MPAPSRRRVLSSMLAMATAMAALARPSPLPSIVVLDLDFIEDHPRPDAGGAQARRLVAAHRQLQQALSEAGLYRVIELAPAEPLLRQLRAQQTWMYRCVDCAGRIGRKLGADLVMTAWVQKVSELILNFNVEVHDVATGKPLLSKSVDMRGNNDESWRRAVAYLVRDMVDRRQRDPNYGR